MRSTHQQQRALSLFISPSLPLFLSLSLMLFKGEHAHTPIHPWTQSKTCRHTLRCIRPHTHLLTAPQTSLCTPTPPPPHTQTHTHTHTHLVPLEAFFRHTACQGPLPVTHCREAWHAITAASQTKGTDSTTSLFHSLPPSSIYLSALCCRSACL